MPALKKDQSISALGWLRCRQEVTELRYWLSLFSYDSRDRSLTNRLYLIYLFIFVGLMVIIGLMFAARGASQMLMLIFPASAANGALLLSLLVLSLFFIYHLGSGLFKPLLIFSHEDTQILAQQPVNPVALVLRWFIKPWLQSALIFSILQMLIAFAYAETQLPQANIGAFFPQYFWIGFRQVLTILPFHLLGFLISLIFSLLAMRKQRRFQSLLPGLAAGLLAILLTVSAFLSPIQVLSNYPLLTGQSLMHQALIAGAVFLCLTLCLAMLAITAKKFDPLQAARETALSHQIADLARYGRTDAISLIKQQKRLGLRRVSRFLPAWQGIAAFLWKDLLTFSRQLSLTELFRYLGVLTSAFSLQLTLQTGSLLPCAFWAYLTLRLLTPPLREELKQWPILRQLPLSLTRIVAVKLAIPILFIAVSATIGIVLGAVVNHSAVLPLLVTLPALIISTAGAAVFDLFRKAKTDALSNQIVADWGLPGLAMAVYGIWCPIWLLSLVRFPPALGVTAGWLFAALAFFLARQKVRLSVRR